MIPRLEGGWFHWEKVVSYYETEAMVDWMTNQCIVGWLLSRAIPYKQQHSRCRFLPESTERMRWSRKLFVLENFGTTDIALVCYCRRKRPMR